MTEKIENGMEKIARRTTGAKGNYFVASDQNDTIARYIILFRPILLISKSVMNRHNLS